MKLPFPGYHNLAPAGSGMVVGQSSARSMPGPAGAFEQIAPPTRTSAPRDAFGSSKAPGNESGGFALGDGSTCCLRPWSTTSSAQRLVLSCVVLRERSDRGPRQLQYPSYAARFCSGLGANDGHHGSGTWNDEYFDPRAPLNDSAVHRNMRALTEK
jgi:hypothetical protein